MSDRIREELERWGKTTLNKAVSKSPERQPSFQTTSHIALKNLSTPLDVEDADYCRDLGFPGEFPFTRGVQPTMYRGRFWTMRQYAGFATAEETNNRYKYLLNQGQTGLSVAFDLPTQIGYDSDHPLSDGEVGKVGVAIDTLQDMEILFDGIPLDKVSTSMTINSTAAILMAMYIAVAEKQGVKSDLLQGTIQNDVLKEYAARGPISFRPTNRCGSSPTSLPSARTAFPGGIRSASAATTCARPVAPPSRRWRSRWPTASPIWRPRFRRGWMSIPSPPGSRSFLLPQQFHRRGRKIPGRPKALGDHHEGALQGQKRGVLHAAVSYPDGGLFADRAAARQQCGPVAFQAMAAVLGGTQSLHTNSRDEAYALPTEDSVRLALRTQQIIAYESGVADMIDPLGGSYVVEALTNEIEGKAIEYIKKIEAMGGAIQAIESGYIQKEIAESAYQYQKEIEAKKRIVVGINRFQMEEKPLTDILRIRPEVEEYQKEKLSRVKKSETT